jgi:hypothetical protein
MWSKAKVDVLEGEFLVLFLAIVDRIPAKEGTTPLHEEDYVQNSKLRASYLAEVLHSVLSWQEAASLFV